MKPTLAADSRCHTGENPLWHPMERRLYWTDIPNGRLYRLDPASGEWEECYRGDPVGGFTVQDDGALLLFMARGAVGRWRNGALDILVRGTSGEEDSRFNDVIADPRGRVFAGTMSTPQHKGRLYRMDTDGSLHVVLEGMGTPNGMGFTADRKHLYVTDSRTRRIRLFDYEEDTGNISNPRLWLETPAGDGAPDGLTVDSQGYVWSARWNGSAVYRYSPDGVESERIDLPARKVSCITFGGESYDELFLTTALAGGSRESEGAGAGALFRCKAGIRGVPEFASRVGMPAG
jgi:sugar lactone lactonase YvrE